MMEELDQNSFFLRQVGIRNPALVGEYYGVPEGVPEEYLKRWCAGGKCSAVLYLGILYHLPGAQIGRNLETP